MLTISWVPVRKSVDGNLRQKSRLFASHLTTSMIAIVQNTIPGPWVYQIPQKKVWSLAYLYGGSGKTLKRISNTPHPYGWRRAKCTPIHSYPVRVMCCPRFDENLPDFHTRMKHTLSSICQSIPWNRHSNLEKTFGHSKRFSWPRVRGTAATVNRITKIRNDITEKSSISSIKAGRSFSFFLYKILLFRRPFLDVGDYLCVKVFGR